MIYKKYIMEDALESIIDYRGKTPQKSDEGIVTLSAKSVRDGYIDYSQAYYISQDEYNKFMVRGFPQVGDVLLTTEAPLGVTARLDRADVALAQRLLTIRGKKDVLDTGFLYYFLKSPVGQAKLLARQTGTTVTGIKQAEFRKIEIEIPEIKTQRKISAILESLDKKIKINQKINDNLLQQAMALFISWFISFDPFSGIMPGNWSETILDDVCSLISRGITPKYDEASDQMVINQKCIRAHTLDLSPARHHLPKVVNEKWLKFGDLLINSTGEGTLGRTAQVYFEPCNMTVDSHVTIVRPAKENLIFYVGIWGLLHEREIEALHTGSTGQTELPRERLKAMKIFLPDQYTLVRFNTTIAPLTKMIVHNQDENRRLSLIRDYLLPRLMSGEIDVSNITI